MTRFIIKVVCKATEKNENFKGETQVYYTAKNSTIRNEAYIRFLAKECGYKTKAAALQGLKKENELAKWENGVGYWNTSCELIEVEI